MKQQIASLFDQVSSGYDIPEMRYFPFSADYMVNLARPNVGNRVLDIATGTGMIAIAAAQYIRPGGRVQAIDISEGMLNKAQKNISKHALDNIDIHNMDAERLEFRTNYFDLIFCGFGLFFLQDAAAALRHWHRVLKPGGRIFFSTFASSAFMPMAGWFKELIEATGAEFPQQIWQSFSSEADCLALLPDELYCERQTTLKQHGIHLKTAQEWWNIIINSGLRGYLDLLSPEQQAELYASHMQQLETLQKDDGIWLDVNVIYTQAQKRS